MAIIKAGTFSYRDFLENILPTLIAVCLYSPYIQSLESIELVFVGAVLAGIAISSATNRLSSFFWLPFLRKRKKELIKQKCWHNENWNYDKLFYSLTKDEREYNYLTAAYATCFRITSFYFFIYFTVQIFSLIPICIDVYRNQYIGWQMIINHNTPMLGNWELSTWIVAFVALLISFSLYKDYLLELEVLFTDGGQYIEFATHYHTTNGGFAKSIWGTVSYNGNDHLKPDVANVKVLLKFENENEPRETKTDEFGRFQFKGLFIFAVGKNFIITAKSNNDLFNGSISVNSLEDKTLPEYNLELKKAS